MGEAKERSVYCDMNGWDVNIKGEIREGHRIGY